MCALYTDDSHVVVVVVVDVVWMYVDVCMYAGGSSSSTLLSLFTMPHLVLSL
jgi:hypothetical protein